MRNKDKSSLSFISMRLLNVTGQHDRRIENLTRDRPLFSALHNAILDTFTIKEGVFDNSG